LLTSEDDKVKAEGGPARARRPIERAIVAASVSPRDLNDVLKDDGVTRASTLLEKSLQDHGLLFSLSGPAAWTRIGLSLAAVVALEFVGLHKLGLAAARGRGNTGFLTALLFMVPIPFLLVTLTRRTALGDRAIEDFRTLCRRVRDNAAQIRPGASSELALLAAAYGLSGLPEFVGERWPFFRKRTVPTGSDSTTSAISCSSSSCSSSGSDSGGGCGGGGGCSGCGGGD